MYLVDLASPINLVADHVKKGREEEAAHHD